MKYPPPPPKKKKKKKKYAGCLSLVQNIALNVLNFEMLRLTGLE